MAARCASLGVEEALAAVGSELQACIRNAQADETRATRRIAKLMPECYRRR
jgi:hypothetical protein